MHLPPFDNRNTPIIDVDDARVPLKSKETEDLHSAWKTFTLRQDFFPCSKLQTVSMSHSTF